MISCDITGGGGGALLLTNEFRWECRRRTNLPVGGLNQVDGRSSAFQPVGLVALQAIGGS